MKTIDVTITGIMPLLMHAPRSVDTMEPMTKEKKLLTSKRKKSDSDIEKIDWLDYQLALYHDGTQPVIPTTNLVGCIRDGAKAVRRGREVQAAVDVEGLDVPLLFDGPKDPEGLYRARFCDRRMIRNKGGGGSVMRVRPMFKTWALAFRLQVDEEIMNPADARTALEYAGMRVGLGDFRPRFGRFEISSWKETKR